MDPELRGAPRHVGGVSAGDHGLRGRAAYVQTGAADEMSLDDSEALSDAGEPGRKRRSGLPGADDDRVEVFNIAHVLIQLFRTEPSNRADRPPKAEIYQAVVKTYPGRNRRGDAQRFTTSAVVRPTAKTAES
jgi:hypothetical protein